MRELNFRAWNKETKSMMLWDDIIRYKDIKKLISLKHTVIQHFTGFKDCDGLDIYEGDTLIDVDVILEDGVKLEDTKQQVYWCEKLGCWKLDNSFVQDASSGYLLANELKDYRFKITGNIYENRNNAVYSS